MTDLDLQELKKAAENALLPPYRIETSDCETMIIAAPQMLAEDYANEPIVTWIEGTDEQSVKFLVSAANSHHALIARIEELEAAVQRVREFVDLVELADHPMGGFIADYVLQALEGDPK